MTFDLVHVFRLYLAPFAGPFVAAGGHGGPAAVLDVDDDEPRSHRRLSALHAVRGRVEAEADEADKYERFEREWLPRLWRTRKVLRHNGCPRHIRDSIWRITGLSRRQARLSCVFRKWGARLGRRVSPIERGVHKTTSSSDGRQRASVARTKECAVSDHQWRHW